MNNKIKEFRGITTDNYDHPGKFMKTTPLYPIGIIFFIPGAIMKTLANLVATLANIIDRRFFR